jgi:DNA-binding NtrC family response regulator
MEPAKILAIDDEENFLQLLIRTLTKEGYEVRTATDGQEALRWLQCERFDLALIDIRMAPINGLAVLEDIKRRYPLMKVIMITAYPSTETQTLSLQRGAYRYLTKPIEIHELKETIRAVLSCVDKGNP